MSVKPAKRADCETITNARIVTPDGILEDGYVRIKGDRIVDVGAGSVNSSRTTTNAMGRLVLPGLVDLHGDDLERHLSPRDGARVDTRTALMACDRANIAAGITTKFNAVAFENAPDTGRSLELAEEVVDVLGTLDGMLADNRVHARCELGEDRAVEGVVQAVGGDLVDLVSLMNHRPGNGQFDGVQEFNRRYADGGAISTEDAERTGERRLVSPTEAEQRIDQIVQASQAADVTIASHDDDDERQVESMWRRGVSISEFPVTLAAAQRASQLGMVTTMGAPNLVRGESLWGNLSATDAIRAGAVDVLCTDYHPQSLLASVFEDTGEILVDRVARVTEAPADAVGLNDRGRIEAGARADLIVINPSSPPRVRRAFVGGAEVYRAASGS